jgi:hypothetical protein
VSQKRLDVPYPRDTESPEACKGTVTCHKETEAYTEKIQSDPGMMQFTGEHHKVPKEEAVVMLVRRLRKWRRD